MTPQTEHKKIPCTCIKGGYELTPEGGERVCGRCKGTEWIDAPREHRFENKGKTVIHVNCVGGEDCPYPPKNNPHPSSP